MQLTPKVIKSIETSVLCWLATATLDGLPNVSPKEIFTHFDGTEILIANISSPGSMRNIKINPAVCVSFIDIFTQKGYQVKGQADILSPAHSEFLSRSKPLVFMAGNDFPFSSLIRIKVEKVKAILAPRYVFYPETTEEEQKLSARRTYGCLE